MKSKKRAKRLMARQAAWDAMRGEGGQGMRRKWAKQDNGKNALFTRPGSNKK